MRCIEENNSISHHISVKANKTRAVILKSVKRVTSCPYKQYSYCKIQFNIGFAVNGSLSRTRH